MHSKIEGIHCQVPRIVQVLSMHSPSDLAKALLWCVRNDPLKRLPGDHCVYCSNCYMRLVRGAHNHALYVNNFNQNNYTLYNNAHIIKLNNFPWGQIFRSTCVLLFDFLTLLSLSSAMQSQFDAKGYLLARYQSPETRSSHLKFFYRFFSEYCENWDTSKAVLLELGAGPSLQLALAGSAFFSNIVFSDFEDSCMEEVKLWVNRSPGAFDWKPTVRYLLENCEGMTESEVDSCVVAQRENEVRRKITAIVHCDAAQENLGLDRAIIPEGGFDVITAYASLTSAATQQEDFVQVLSNARSVLKKGGFLCALIAGKCTHYCVSPESAVRRPTCFITEKCAKEGFEAAGMHIEEFEVSRPQPGVADVAEVYLCIARK